MLYQFWVSETKMEARIFVIFLDRPMFIEHCSVILFKRSRRELSIDVAERRSTSKNKGVVRIFVIFKIDLCSAIIQKVPARAFY